MLKNETDALIDVLQKINAHGEKVVTRGFEQKEILANLEKIIHPNERVILVPHRNNNIFALIAETLWVMGGRNDLDFLSFYLPRAIDFSDDQKTWRAAYGPRLRNWYGVDQFKKVAQLINKDPNTKRAAMIIYDPSKDYVDTKDVPCNNWLHFMARKNKLNLDIAVRANDAIWGFGGINTFEWSVLMQMMAYWTHKEVGTLSWFTGTIHVYSRHYKKAKRIINDYQNKDLYDFGFSSLPFTTNIEKFDSLLKKVFSLEVRMRFLQNYDSKLYSECGEISDKLLRQFAQMLFIYNRYIQGAEKNELRYLINELEESDVKVAAIEYLERRLKDKSFIDLTSKEKDFFEWYRSEHVVMADEKL